MRLIGSLLFCGAVLLVGGCAQAPQLNPDNAQASCQALAAPIGSNAIGLPTSGASIDSASLITASPLAVAERGPTPAATITPAAPAYCRLVGRIAPVDQTAPPIMFQVNLPLAWNGRSLQYGGGGFNGVLISGLNLVPAAPYDKPSPLAQGFVTVGTDSGHQNRPGQPLPAFAQNDEALLNFAHASYKKVRDVSVALMQRAYGRKPDRMYFAGSSEGGREGVTMAQRYPDAFDGIFSRVPVLHWTGLQHAGLRDGLAISGEGWLPPALVKRVHDAVLTACDSADGVADSIVSDPVGCRARFDVASLQCTAGQTADCLNPAQVAAVRGLNSPLRFDFDLANGLREYPGRGPSGEGLPASGPTGGWGAWWTGSSPAALPPKPDNGIGWVYGSGAIQHFYMRNPQGDLRSYRPQDHLPRIREISALMDSTNPDLSAFRARGGKLIVLENMADYAQSPYAGIQWFESVQRKLGREQVATFARLYTAPGVDHVGTGGPANADFLGALVGWVERGQAPAGLQLIEQNAKPPFATLRARPLCEWPMWPRYRSGDAAQAASFECVNP